MSKNQIRKLKRYGKLPAALKMEEKMEEMAWRFNDRANERVQEAAKLFGFRGMKDPQIATDRIEIRRAAALSLA